MDAMELVAFKVNGTEWRLRDVLKLACMEERFSAVEDSIRRAIMKEFAEQHQISIDEQEWKAKANELRQQLGLYSAAETLAWLKVRGLTMVDLFESAKARLLTEKVKRIASEDKVDAYYLKSRLSYDKAIISQLIVGCREQAQELLFQLEMIDAHPELRVYLLEQLADDAMRKFLKRTALFAPLHHQELRSLLDIMVMKEYAPGQAIVREGEMGDAFYILRTGTASVLKESEGNRKLNIVKAGEFFGELALLTGDPRKASVIADEAVSVFSLAKNDFDKLILKYPKVRETIIGIASAYLQNPVASVTAKDSAVDAPKVLRKKPNRRSNSGTADEGLGVLGTDSPCAFSKVRWTAAQPASR